MSEDARFDLLMALIVLGFFIFLLAMFWILR